VIGFVIALFASVCALFCLVIDGVPSRWPFGRITRTDTPELFWFFIAMYFGVAVLGVMYGLVRLLGLSAT